MDEEKQITFSAPNDELQDEAVCYFGENFSFKMTKELSNEVSELIPVDRWKELALMLCYQQHDINGYEEMIKSFLQRDEQATSSGRFDESGAIKSTIKQMLLDWCESDDSIKLNVENLIYTLKGLKMNIAAEHLKRYCESVANR